MYPNASPPNLKNGNRQDWVVAVSYLPDVFSLCNEDAGKSIVNFYVSPSDSYFLTLTRPRGGGEGMGLGKKDEKDKSFCNILLYFSHVYYTFA